MTTIIDTELLSDVQRFGAGEPADIHRHDMVRQRECE